MIAGVLTSILAAVVVLLAFYTWIDAYITRGEAWSVTAWLTGIALAALTLAAGLSWTFGW